MRIVFFGSPDFAVPALEALIAHHDVALVVTQPDKPEDCRNPIDVFFQSLAEQRQASAVGIILSGNGTDGTLGLKAISDAGGMAIAQDPAALRNFLAGHFTMGTVSTALLLEAGTVEMFDQQRTTLPVVTSRGATTIQVGDSVNGSTGIARR